MAANVLLQTTISAAALQAMTVGASNFNWINNNGTLGPVTTQPTLSRVAIPAASRIVTAGYAALQVLVMDGGQGGIVAGSLGLSALFPTDPPSPAGQLSYGTWTLAGIGTGANLFLLTLSNAGSPSQTNNNFAAGTTAPAPVPPALALFLTCTTAPTSATPLTIAVFGITPQAGY